MITPQLVIFLLGTNLWIVWTSRCWVGPQVHLRHHLTGPGVPTSPALPSTPPAPPGPAPLGALAPRVADRLPGALRLVGVVAGPVRGRTTGTRSRWAGWRPGWWPIAAG